MTCFSIPIEFKEEFGFVAADAKKARLGEEQIVAVMRKRTQELQRPPSPHVAWLAPAGYVAAAANITVE